MTPVDRGVLALVLVSAVLGLCVHYDSATDRWSSATPSLYVSSDPRVLVVALPIAGTVLALDRRVVGRDATVAARRRAE